MGKEYKNSMKYDALHALLSTIDLKLVCKTFLLYFIIDFLIKDFLWESVQQLSEITHVLNQTQEYTKYK